MEVRAYTEGTYEDSFTYCNLAKALERLDPSGEAFVTWDFAGFEIDPRASVLEISHGEIISLEEGCADGLTLRVEGWYDDEMTDAPYERTFERFMWIKGKKVWIHEKYVRVVMTRRAHGWLEVARMTFAEVTKSSVAQ